MMEKAIFSLKNYTFEEIVLDLANLSGEEVISLSFDPRGIYNQKEGLYLLSFSFFAHVQTKKEPIVHVRCDAAFQFRNPLPIEEIPSYFYSNSIAILFPYIRSMVSTLTLQANVKPIILPTMNLTPLQQKLQQKTTVK